MKQIFKISIAVLSACVLLCLSGCVSMPVSQQSGLTDKAFLLFVSNDTYVGETVNVQCNDFAFKAKVVKASKSNYKGTAYQITPGTKTVTVYADGKQVFKRKLFVSNQETKIIQLP